MSQPSTAMVTAARVAPHLLRIILFAFIKSSPPPRLSLEFSFNGNFTTLFLILFVFLIWKFGSTFFRGEGEVPKHACLLNKHLQVTRYL